MFVVVDLLLIFSLDFFFALVMFIYICGLNIFSEVCYGFFKKELIYLTSNKSFMPSFILYILQGGFFSIETPYFCFDILHKE